MATRFNGGIIGVRNSTTGGTGGLATGRFSSNEVLLSVKDGTWPTQDVPEQGFSLWTWGLNSSGQLGQNDTVDRSSPVQIGIYDDWVDVKGKAFTAGIRSNRTLWAWGYNNYGQLGLGNRTDYSSPKQIGSLTNWLSVSAGYQHCLATKTDGTLWAWGNGGYGQLGQDNGTARSSPIQVGSLTNWLRVGAGGYTSLAVSN
jgi:alpha-tubulin suppressor-like RCC1 family protein